MGGGGDKAAGRTRILFEKYIALTYKYTIRLCYATMYREAPVSVSVTSVKGITLPLSTLRRTLSETCRLSLSCPYFTVELFSIFLLRHPDLLPFPSPPANTLYRGPIEKITPFSRLVLASNFELSPLDAIQVEICRGVDSPLPVRAEYGLKILIVIESERRALRLYWIKVRQREGFILHLLEWLF